MKKPRSMRLGKRTWSQLERLAAEWLQVDGRTRVVEILVEREIVKMEEEMKGKDWVNCPDCGEEYNRLGPGHECDPRILEQLAQDAADDAEVREQEEA